MVVVVVVVVVVAVLLFILFIEAVVVAELALLAAIATTWKEELVKHLVMCLYCGEYCLVREVLVGHSLGN